MGSLAERGMLAHHLPAAAVAAVNDDGGNWRRFCLCVSVAMVMILLPLFSEMLNFKRCHVQLAQYK